LEFLWVLFFLWFLISVIISLSPLQSLLVQLFFQILCLFLLFYRFHQYKFPNVMYNRLKILDIHQFLFEKQYFQLLSFSCNAMTLEQFFQKFRRGHWKPKNMHFSTFNIPNSVVFWKQLLLVTFLSWRSHHYYKLFLPQLVLTMFLTSWCMSISFSPPKLFDICVRISSFGK